MLAVRLRFTEAT